MIEIDPMLCDSFPANYDTLFCYLESNSPCIGRGIDAIEIEGTNYECPNTDFSGNQRPNPVDNLVDMGARELGFKINGIEEWQQQIPDRFTLEQNYPNPFNPSTTIRYQVGANNHSPLHVELSIFNILGQKVATLVSGKQQAGQHQVTWNASGYASGVYFYRLQTENYIQTKKLIVLR